jgi:hypothetical protein
LLLLLFTVLLQHCREREREIVRMR